MLKIHFTRQQYSHTFQVRTRTTDCNAHYRSYHQACLCAVRTQRRELRYTAVSCYVRVSSKEKSDMRWIARARRNKLISFYVIRRRLVRVTQNTVTDFRNFLCLIIISPPFSNPSSPRERSITRLCTAIVIAYVLYYTHVSYFFPGESMIRYSTAAAAARALNTDRYF